MSHIVQIKTEVRDAVAVQEACQRLGLYPAVFDTRSGQVRFDNYGGRWGEQVQLDRFLQAYAVEKATLEARRKGHTVTEQTLDNGSIKLTVTVGGAA